MYPDRTAHPVLYWDSATYLAVVRTLLSGSLVYGSEISRLQRELSCMFSVAQTVLCGSGSCALALALRACGVARGDEVIVPALCCSAVLAPVLAAGASPVLADIGIELNLTPNSVGAVLSDKTKAVIVPHLSGNPADIEAIAALLRDKSICLIDDAAQALGARVGGRPAGSFGDFGILSFGTGKICSGLGGGALIVTTQLTSRISLSTLSRLKLQRSWPHSGSRSFGGIADVRFYRSHECSGPSMIQCMRHRLSPFEMKPWAISKRR